MKLPNSFLNRLILFLSHQKFWGVYLVIFFIAIRLPYLGYSNFNTDSFKWKQRIYDFGTGVFTLDFQKTNQKYHPGVTLLWVGTIAVKFHTLVNDYISPNPSSENSVDYMFSLNYYQILFVVIFCAFLYFFLYLLISKLWGELKSLVVLAVIALEPFFMGLTTTLHLDGILSILMINCLVSFYLFLSKDNKKYLYLSAVFMGLALLTKTTALLLLPILVVVYIFTRHRFRELPLLNSLWALNLTSNPNKILTTLKSFFTSLPKMLAAKNFFKIIFSRGLPFYKNFIFTFFIFSLISCLVYFLLWPSMWQFPIDTINTVYKGVTVGTDDHSQIFFGQLVSDPGPLYYLLVFITKTPVYIFLAVLLALYIQLNTTYKKYTFEIFILMSSILFLIEISIPSKKLDRYILPTMLLVSVWSLSYLYDRYKKLVYSFFIINLLVIFYLRYDFFSYFNPLIGDNRFAPFWIESKWAYGQKELVEFFRNEITTNKYETFSLDELDVGRIDRRHQKLIVAIPEKYYTQLHPYLRLLESQAVINDLSAHAQKANYFIFPAWDHRPEYYMDRYFLKFLTTIKVRGEDTYFVYKKYVP